MMIKRIYEDSSLASMFAIINEAVSFKGIAIRISGVNGATATTLGDIGRIQYMKRGQMIIDAGFDYLIALNQLLNGTPNITSGSSSALDFFLYIPRRLNDANVEYVEPRDNAQLKCTFGANLATRVASAGKVEVYLDLEDGVQLYDMYIRQYSDSVAGASVRPFTVDQPNIALVGLSATVSAVLTLTGSNITQVTTEIGGKTADSTIGALQDNTSDQFNYESATIPYAIMAVPYMALGDMSSRLYDNARVLITTSGASSPEVIVVGALFNDAKYDATVARQADKMNQIVTAKRTKGDSATLTTLGKAAGMPSGSAS